jgi:GxxExxY protein
MSHALNGLSHAIIGCALAVHREVGPGLLESAYQSCLAFEFLQRQLSIERQKPLPLIYKGERLDLGFRIDFLVEDQIIVEVKACERLERVHSAQLRSYLRLSGRTLGLLINFNVRLLVDEGVRRVVNGFQE